MTISQLYTLPYISLSCSINKRVKKTIKISLIKEIKCLLKKYSLSPTLFFFCSLAMPLQHWQKTEIFITAFKIMKQNKTPKIV